MDDKVQAEILALTKVKPKAGESAEDFTRRALKKVNSLADADAQNWESLSEDSQAWVNTNMSAEEAETALSCLELPDAVEEPAELEASDDGAQGEAAEAQAEQETEVSTKKVSKPKKKPAPKAEANGDVAPKKAAAPKPAVKPKAVAKPAPAKKPVAAKKPAVAKKPKGDGESRGRKPLFPDDGKIKILAKDNPHREGTVRDKAFKKIKAGMTVAEAVKAGAPRQQVWSMWKRGIISVTGASA